MRAFAIDRIGDVGSLRELPTPDIGPDEMLVRVRAAGVNPFDVKLRDGGKAVVDLHFPFVLGQDAAGTVAKVGKNVTRFAVGQAVYGGLWLAGAFAEYVRVSPKAAVAHKPTTVDFPHAAALPSPALAAAAALRAVTLQPGETVLIVGATGGVGTYAVQMATRGGASVIATAQADTEAYVRKLGAKEIVDYTRGDITAAVKSTHPAGIDAVIDVVSGGAQLQHIASVLRPGGRLVSSIHAADEAVLSARGLSGANIDVLGATGGLEDITRFVDKDEMRIPLQRTYPLRDAAEALAAVKAGRLRGRIVLTVS